VKRIAQKLKNVKLKVQSQKGQGTEVRIQDAKACKETRIFSPSKDAGSMILCGGKVLDE
jgi:hypothetical protein